MASTYIMSARFINEASVSFGNPTFCWADVAAFAEGSDFLHIMPMNRWVSLDVLSLDSPVHDGCGFGG